MKAVLLLLACIALASHGFYSKKGDVIVVDSPKYIESMEKSNFLWLVELYREGCGYCQQLTPHWNGVASKLRKLVRVAAVDVEKQQGIAQSLMQKYNFQIQGVPTLFLLKPSRSSARKAHVPYQGERTTSALYRTALDNMPDYSTYVTSKSLAKFQQSELPQALLVSSKKATPPIWKALSSKYKQRMALGTASSDQSELMSSLGITEAPAIVVFNNSEPVTYAGSVNFAEIDFFLMDYALKKNTSASSTPSPPSPSPSAQQKKKTKTESSPPPKSSSKARAKSATSKDNKQRTDLAKLKRADMEKMRIKELRSILEEYNAPCRGCIEKTHYMDRIAELAAQGLRPNQRLASSEEAKAAKNPLKKLSKTQLIAKVEALEEKIAALEAEKDKLQASGSCSAENHYLHEDEEQVIVDVPESEDIAP